jgi:gamma-glutamyltranspeptidase
MMRRSLCFAVLGPALLAQRIPEQTRSMVITKFGIVATSQTPASQAGAMVLESGGNAIDANATLAWCSRA